VHERALDVDVMLAAAHEEQRGAQVDEDADAGHHHHREALRRLGRVQAAEGFPGERAHRHQQKQCVGKRGQDRRALPAVGVARAGPHAAGERTAPGKHQAGHVAEVVAGVGQQRQRVDLPAIKRLDGNEPDVQRDADRERAVEAGRRVVVGVAVVMASGVRVRMR
jgi:hypothetical protein